jgi:lipoprotein signal peptidase
VIREPARLRLGLLLGLLILVLDQASKWWVLEVLRLPELRRVVVTENFNLTMVWNRGVTFGLLASDFWWKPWLLGGLALAVAGFLLVWLSRAESRLVAIGLGGVIGGAVGNVIDRARFGAVVDFLDFHAFGFHWYAFNVADAAIVCGVGMLMLDALIRPSPEAKQSP